MLTTMIDLLSGDTKHTCRPENWLEKTGWSSLSSHKLQVVQARLIRCIDASTLTLTLTLLAIRRCFLSSRLVKILHRIGHS
jgi:hypothetical protein